MVSSTRETRLLLPAMAVLAATLPAWAASKAATRHYEAGVKAKQSKDFSTAIAELKAAIELEAGCVDAHWALAWTCVAANDSDSGGRHFREVVRLAPDSDKGRKARKALERLGLPVDVADSPGGPERPAESEEGNGAAATLAVQRTEGTLYTAPAGVEAMTCDQRGRLVVATGDGNVVRVAQDGNATTLCAGLGQCGLFSYRNLVALPNGEVVVNDVADDRDILVRLDGNGKRHMVATLAESLISLAIAHDGALFLGLFAGVASSTPVCGERAGPLSPLPASIMSALRGTLSG